MDDGKCISHDKLNNCNKTDLYRCVECDNGYYLEDHNCYECTEGCITCNNDKYCTECEEDYVKRIESEEFECIEFSEIEHCISSIESSYSSFEDDYELDVSKLKCNKEIRLTVWLCFGSILLIIVI